MWKNFIPTEKYGGGYVMVWGCSAASATRQLAGTDSTMNFASYQKVLEDNVMPSL